MTGPYEPGLPATLDPAKVRVSVTGLVFVVCTWMCASTTVLPPPWYAKLMMDSFCTTTAGGGGGGGEG